MRTLVALLVKSLVGLLVLFAVFWTGRWSVDGGDTVEVGTGSAKTAADAAAASPTLWTCPMHPEIQMPEFGDCPKCGMDLVKRAKGDDAGPRQLAMSPAAMALADIQTVPVERRFLTLPVRMVGKVDFDETRVRTIAARVAGRLDRLFVDYTGVQVERDDHLVELYSPALLTAQQELLQAKQRLGATAEESNAFLRDSDRRGYEGAREKLILWGLSAAQVDAIEARGTAEDRILIRSPAAGVVLEKMLAEGDYVQEGTPIYRIADLTHLWIELDAYEQDLPWLRYGQEVAVHAEAFPGEVFEGWISFVAPIVDERTRTVGVRVHVTNPELRLKPGMFVRAVVSSRIGTEGQVLEPRLRGKWISPMHPEIVKDGPGQCDVCGMDLVPAEQLFAAGGSGAENQKPVVVPASAVLVTGVRAVVYVKVPGKKKPTFEGREVVLGPRAGDHYVVRAGLRENEEVVVHGAFRIDSSMQIQAKPSMMSMDGETNTFTGPSTAVFRLSLSGLYAAYLELQQALGHDDLANARAAVAGLRTALGEIEVGGLSREAVARWEEERELLERAVTEAAEASSIAGLRVAFEDLSRAMLALERTFRHAGGQAHYEAFCPMAFDDKGASWLQLGEQILNPYFGASMLRCGEVRGEWLGVSDTARQADQRQAVPGGETGGLEPVEIESLAAVYTAYLDLQEALAADELYLSRSHFGALREALSKVEVVPAGGASSEVATTALTALREASRAATPADLAELRVRFEPLTEALLRMHDVAGHAGTAPLRRMHCPMAFDNRGADWLQRGAELSNPYFGASMLRCGTEVEVLPARGERR